MLDDEIKNHIKKCSRCALCVQNCPIYSVTKNENNTARGLICKLNGFERGDLNKEELKSLKICLNCSKCENNCPSGIKTSEIFAYKNTKFYPAKISQRLLLTVKLLPIKILYFLNFFKFQKNTKKNSNILYFKGCIARAQHKSTFLDSTCNCVDFACCGLPYLTSGDIKNYKRAKEKNIKLIKNSSKVVFDCASCKSAVEKYSGLDENEKQKLVFLNDFIENQKFRLKKNSKYKNKTVVFHKPCHLDKKDFEKIEIFLEKIENLNYKKLENPDSCCGFGGSYFIFHPVVSIKIALKKAKNIKNSKPDLILSACPSCVLGLRFNQIISFNFKKTMELRDFIDKELETV